MKEVNQKRPHRQKIKAGWKWVPWTNIKSDHSKRMPDKEDKDHKIKMLDAEIGNLTVQVSEYSQIIAELTEKLQRYEEKYGSVFVKKT